MNILEETLSNCKSEGATDNCLPVLFELTA